MDFGLLQKDVAKMFNVTVDCIENWELNRHPPVTRNRQKILDFLGPECSFLSEDMRLGIRLKEYRKSENLSQVELSKQIGIRQNLISEIELGKRRILKKTQDRIQRFLLEKV